MARGRRDEWSDDFEVYTPNQVESVLEFCEVEVVGDTHTHFLAYCPFHGNTDSPAMAIDKTKGLFTCFNPSCMQSGTLLDLLRLRKGQNPFQAQRTIIKYANVHSTPFSDRLAEAMKKEPEFVEFPQNVLDKMKADFPGSIGEDYMLGRGFEYDTLDFFDVGYSAKKNMVIVPMHDPKGMPVGLIGRTPSKTDKRFKNSKNLPKSKTAWNFHRAKTHGDTVIVCEASFDAMRIHQAGYPNVVALLGGHVTSFHAAQIARTFSKVIIMTDFDKKIFRPNCRMCRGAEKCLGHRPGRDLGRSIVKNLPGQKVMWASYDSTCVYPHNAKDAGDMTDEEIRHCLRNAISNLEYSQWDIEENVPEVIAS
jgi:5S rRNA maturation endonuclease (ribonuclease M5)